MTTLDVAQLEQVWDTAGGDPHWAATMAGIAVEESGGRTDALNNNPKTGDYSVGLWQINYYGALAPGRTAEYGSPAQLQADPNLDARAAVALLGDSTKGLSNWQADAVARAAEAAGGPLSDAQVQGIIGAGPTSSGAVPAGGATATTAQDVSVLGSIGSALGALDPLTWAGDLGTVFGAIADDVKTWLFVGAFTVVGAVMVIAGLKSAAQDTLGTGQGAGDKAESAAKVAALAAA